MVEKQYIYRTRSIPATPRNRRLTDGIQTAAESGGGYYGSGASIPQYWELVFADQEGNLLPDGSEYISTKYTARADGNLVAGGDVLAYAIDNSTEDLKYPVASYALPGIVQVKANAGLIVNDGLLEVNPSFVGGLDVEELQQYLTTNQYVTQSGLADYLKLTSSLTGYALPATYSAITPEDTILSAFGKLERNFSNYVDLTTNQTIGGSKTFNDTLFGKNDIVCYAVDGNVDDIVLPTATTTRLGVIKVGNNLSITADGVLSAQSGGTSFTPGTALELTAGNLLNVKFGTTAATACAGNDSRLSDARSASDVYAWAKASEKPSYAWAEIGNKPGWIGASKPSYTFSEVGALSSSDSRISGWNTAASNAHFHSNKDYLDTINQSLRDTSTPDFNALSVSSSSPYYKLTSGGYSWDIAMLGSTDLLFKRQGNVIMTFTTTGHIMAVGDIVAYSASTSTSDITGTATPSTYGLVKYDNSTIKLNAYGQLQAVVSGGGSTSLAWSDITGKPNVLSSVNTSGSGNVVTGISASGSVITVTKGTISEGGTTASWDTDSGNTVYLTVAGARKQLALAGGFGIPYVSAQYNSVKIAGATYDYSRNGHTHSQYLTSHQSIYALTIQVNGSTVGTYTPNSAARTINISTGSGGGSWNGGTVSNNITISRSGATLLFLNGSYSWAFLNSGSTFYLNKNGSAHLYVVGANWTLNSDERIKNIGSPIEGVLEKIQGLRVFKFEYKYRKGYGTQLGVSAQEVHRVFPEIVTVGAYEQAIGDNALGVDYSTLGAIVAIGGLKELYQKHLTLENSIKSFAHWRLTKDQQINSLMNENNLLKARVACLERRDA